jgi:hypothetical protein
VTALMKADALNNYSVIARCAGVYFMLLSLFQYTFPLPIGWLVCARLPDWPLALHQDAILFHTNSFYSVAVGTPIIVY